MAQTTEQNDPSLVTGTLTVRYVTVADGGAYSCEALNNQGFIFAIPDAIVSVVTGLYCILKIKINDFVFFFHY
jgi:hypothetical protein